MWCCGRRNPGGRTPAPPPDSTLRAPSGLTGAQIEELVRIVAGAGASGQEQADLRAELVEHSPRPGRPFEEIRKDFVEKADAARKAAAEAAPSGDASDEGQTDESASADPDGEAEVEADDADGADESVTDDASSSGSGRAGKRRRNRGG